jgi:hypothetical protein
VELQSGDRCWATRSVVWGAAGKLASSWSGTARPLPATQPARRESNTKARLIEPSIAALGWDVLDPDEVHREYRRRPADNPVDYALQLSRTPRLFIEAKGLGENIGENINDPKWANGAIGEAFSLR